MDLLACLAFGICALQQPPASAHTLPQSIICLDQKPALALAEAYRDRLAENLRTALWQTVSTAVHGHSPRCRLGDIVVRKARILSSESVMFENKEWMLTLYRVETSKGKIRYVLRNSDLPGTTL